MLAGMGRTGSKMDSGSMAAPPATISTTMVSPTARERPRITAVLIPDREAGTTTRAMVWSWVAPKATDASRRATGTL